MLALGGVHQLLCLGSARVSGPSDGLPGASLWPGAAPLLRDNSLGPPGNNQNLTTKGGIWRVDTLQDHNGSDTITPRAIMQQLPPQERQRLLHAPIAQSLEELACCDYDERNPSFFASNWGGVWRLAGDMIAPSRPSHCLVLLSLN